MIKKVIHQIWIGDQSKRPDEMMQTWKDKHPDWDYQIWTEENIPRLVCQKQFDQMPELNGKADILRFELLLEYGGVYIDADAICLNRLDDFFLDNDAFCCWENEIVRPGLMSTGYVGASQNNELMRALVQTISHLDLVGQDQGPAWKVVGPLLLTKTVEQLNYRRIKIYPSFYFIPRHYTGMEYTGQSKIYADQLWATTRANSRPHYVPPDEIP